MATTGDPASPEVDDFLVKVEEGESQPAQFAAAHARGHDQPGEGVPVVVHTERFFAEPCSLAER